MTTNAIRNFSIIAHIDHGKSTLADRLLELGGAVSERDFQEQLLDDMDIERERGITIKASAVTLTHAADGVEYMLNLIDTPGHIDFHYEVSRALAAYIWALGEVTIGDTITDAARPAAKALPGYKPPLQMVFSDFYPGAQTEYAALREALEKLSLNDSSFTFVAQSSPALGFGFRCGFLGLLHMNIVQERLERESNIDVVQTAPTVSYTVEKTDGKVIHVESPSQLPPPNEIAEIHEPIVLVEIITPGESVGSIMKLAEQRRGARVKQEYISASRVILEYRFPLAEIVYDFYDRLKGITHGYATMDYELVGFEPGDLVKLEILVNKVPVDALSIIVHRSKSRQRGLHLIQRLKQEIPRRQFDIPLQAAIGNAIIARETIKAFRKDVTAGLYGGDVTRKRKVLEKQKAGKRRMKSVGNVEISQEAFMAVLETGE